MLKLLEAIKGIELYKGFSDTLRLVTSQMDEINAKIAEAQRNVDEGIWAFRNLQAIDEFQTELEVLLEKQSQLVNQMFETFTVTSSDAITDSILDGFANGKLGAEDFADTFEELMKNAILESFKISNISNAFLRSFLL